MGKALFPFQHQINVSFKTSFDIRHSTASILYDNGWELKDIQQWLGHAGIGTTGNIYTHLTRMRKENIGKDLEKVFWR